MTAKANNRQRPWGLAPGSGLLLAVLLFWGCLLLLAGSGGAAGPPAVPPPPDPASEQLAKVKELLAQPFTYQRENRIDPFVPFVTEVTVKAPSAEPVGELTGMRQFEPGQLNLVAILFSRENPVAMVEDSLGKGYAIHEGTLIGRNGVVAEIRPNTVIINQAVISTGDSKRTVVVEMVLRKEGEKQR